MPSWNELFLCDENVARVPEREIHGFVSVLERCFCDRPLRIWDLCCGAGRHTVAMARSGHDVYASDAAPNGIARTDEWLSELDLSARTSVCDMTECPWPDVVFHGVLAWDALHHNTLAGTEQAIAGARRQLIPGGLFLATLKSTRADSCGRGQEIEPNTFVQDSGMEAGVPHHYFDEAEIRRVFRDWQLLVLVEQCFDYRERAPEFLDVNPFRYTSWGVLARRPVGERVMASHARGHRGDIIA